jgi:hypothetical protein
MKKVIFIIFFCINNIHAQQENKYLIDIEKTVILRVNTNNSINVNEKKEIINQIMLILNNDSRIISRLPNFESEFNVITQKNGFKKVEFSYDFGTQVSLTSKFFYLKNSKLIIYNFSFLKDYPKFHRTIFNVNYDRNIKEREYLLERIKVLIGEEYFNFIKNSFFQESTFRNYLYVEKHRKIYGDWDNGLIFVYDSKGDVIYIRANKLTNSYIFSENSQIPNDIKFVLNSPLK